MREYENVGKDIGYGAIGIFAAFFGGALAGAATALLLAPSTGYETRRQIRHIAERAKDRVKKTPGRLREASDVAKERASAAYEGAVEGASGTRH